MQSFPYFAIIQWSEISAIIILIWWIIIIIRKLLDKNLHKGTGESLLYCTCLHRTCNWEIFFGVLTGYMVLDINCISFFEYPSALQAFLLKFKLKAFFCFLLFVLWVNYLKTAWMKTVICSIYLDFLHFSFHFQMKTRFCFWLLDSLVFFKFLGGKKKIWI